MNVDIETVSAIVGETATVTALITLHCMIVVMAVTMTMDLGMPRPAGASEDDKP